MFHIAHKKNDERNLMTYHHKIQESKEVFDLNSGSSVIIKNRFNGLMANSNSKDDYLKQLNELMNDSNLRSDLANNSRQNYLDNFTQKSFKKYLEKIENLNI